MFSVDANRGVQVPPEFGPLPRSLDDGAEQDGAEVSLSLTHYLVPALCLSLSQTRNPDRPVKCSGLSLPHTLTRNPKF